jgi:predicted amidophosphoribosyltransferase
MLGKNILLIDDVITTGASTEACIQTLLDAGIGNVSVSSLAFTL